MRNVLERFRNRKAFIILLCVLGIGLATTVAAANTSDFSGWAWFGSSTDDGTPDDGVGWASMSCENQGTCGTVDYAMTINLRTGVLSGDIWIGESSGGGLPGQNAIGWMTFDRSDAGTPPAAPYQSGSFIAKADTVTGEVTGWARILRLKDEGLAHGFDDWGWVRFDGWAQDVVINLVDTTISGYAWSGGGTIPGGAYDPSVGLGWLDFSDAEVDLSLPFYATEGGDIYSRVRVGSARDRPSDTFYTSQYLIQSSGSILNVTSELANGLLPNSTVLSFPQSANGFRNVLGALPEWNEWVTPVKTESNKDYNTFGELIDQPQQHSFQGTIPMTASGDRVSVHEGTDVEVRSNGVEFKNSTTDARGTMVIVVDGDLRINGNITYESSFVTRPEQIASVVWVVFGNVIVDPSVTDVQGVFVVLGSGVPGSGVFRTGTVGGTDVPMELTGMVMAKSFELQRMVVEIGGNDVPAENFTLDGRFFLNTPESLKDFAQAIPTVTDVAR